MATFFDIYEDVSRVFLLLYAAFSMWYSVPSSPVMNICYLYPVEISNKLIRLCENKSGRVNKNILNLELTKVYY